MHCAQAPCTYAAGAMLLYHYQNADASCLGDLSLQIRLQAPMATTLCEVSEFWYKETWLCRYLGEHGRSKHLLGPLFLL